MTGQAGATTDTSPVRAPELRRHVLDPLEDGDHMERWRALASHAIEPNPFFGPQFLRPFLDHMGRANVRLLTVSCAQSGDWLMAAPVATRKLGLAVSAATAWETEFGPLGAPLVSPDASPAVAADFLSHVSQTLGRLLVAFPFVPLDGPVAAALNEASGWNVVCAASAERASHGSGEEGEEQFAMAFRGKRRKEMTRLRRRMGDLGPVVFESHRGKDAVHQFEAFLQLEAAGWKGKRDTALLSHHHAAAFARAMVAERARDDGIRIDSITVAGRPIAMLAVMIERNRAFSWKIAYDEAYARYSPGTQITLFSFERNLSDQRIAGADSLAIPDHPMIDPLWRGRMRYGTLVCTNSVPGRLLQRVIGADMTLEQRLRQLARKLLRRGA